MSPSEISPTAMIGGLLIFVILIAGICADIAILSTLSKDKIDWASLNKRLLRRPWSVFDGVHLLVVISTLFAVMVLIGQIATHCNITPPPTATPFLLFFETLLLQGTALFTIEYLRRRNNSTLSSSFLTPSHRTRKSLKYGLIFYLAIIPPVIISALIANAILMQLGIPIEPQDILKGFGDSTSPIWLRTYLIAMAILIAPLVEETLFRGIALPILAKHASPALAVIATALLFAIIHGHIPALAPLFTLAVGCSMAYIYTGSILVPMTMHAIFNSISLIVFFLSSGVGVQS